MKRTVWGVYSGEYSDYRVHAIYSTKQAAEAAAAEANRLDNRERYEVEDFPSGGTPMREWTCAVGGEPCSYGVVWDGPQPAKASARSLNPWVRQWVNGTDRDEVAALAVHLAENPDEPGATMTIDGKEYTLHMVEDDSVFRFHLEPR